MCPTDLANIQALAGVADRIGRAEASSGDRHDAHHDGGSDGVGS